MNHRSQRSLNAGWTRHNQVALRPQARPVTILTRDDQTLTGVAWLRGTTVSRDELHSDIAAAIAAYQAGTSTRVLTDEVLIQPAPDAVCIPVLFRNIRRVS